MIEIGEIMMQWKIFAIKGGNFAKLKILKLQNRKIVNEIISKNLKFNEKQLD